MKCILIFSSIHRDGNWAYGRTNELVITGRIRSFDAGSRFKRAIGSGNPLARALVGSEPAIFVADLILKDGRTGRELLLAPIDKEWSHDGSKGIEELLAESAASSARTIAEAKGWSRSSTRK